MRLAGRGSSGDDSIGVLTSMVGVVMNGSAISLSGLVQLPPKERSESTLSFEDIDESDIPEHAVDGRLMLSPRTL